MRGRAALLAVAVLLPGAPALAVALPERTFLVSAADGGARSASGQSTRPSVSPGGTRVAFESTSPELAPEPDDAGQLDVFVHDLGEATTRLVSSAPGGLPADGPSDSAVLSGRNGLVAFVSAATNLVAGDTNGARDVFVRVGDNPPRRVSVTAQGGQASGDSSQPDLSRSGSLVAFTSSAPDLVPGDENGVSDVFVADLVSGAVRRVSQPPGDAEPDGASLNPAISPEGRFVAFASAATNLVPGDTKGVPDVVLADLRTGELERVSVSGRGRQQSAAVAAPFAQVPDVSAGGRHVVFDSDAPNLVGGDRNRDTDVFIRDVRARRTERVSLSATGAEGTNDSFNPTITPSGRFVGFESFAESLAAGDAAREDVFVRDLRLGTTSVVGVRSRSALPRGPELVRQLLQRPSLSDDAEVVGFTSTAQDLVAGDGNRAEDVFVRSMDAPAGGFARGFRTRTARRRPALRLRADDPAARTFLCTLDGRRRICGRRSRLPRLAAGRHSLSVRAGGPGMLFSSRASRRTFRVLP